MYGVPVKSPTLPLSPCGSGLLLLDALLSAVEWEGSLPPKGRTFYISLLSPFQREFKIFFFDSSMLFAILLFFYGLLSGLCTEGVSIGSSLLSIPLGSASFCPRTLLAARGFRPPAPSLSKADGIVLITPPPFLPRPGTMIVPAPPPSVARMTFSCLGLSPDGSLDLFF